MSPVYFLTGLSLSISVTLRANQYAILQPAGKAICRFFFSFSTLFKSFHLHTVTFWGTITGVTRQGAA